MSEEYLSANPEFLFHYQRLRRDRALMRRQGYVVLIAAGALLAFTIFAPSISSPSFRIGPGFFVLCIGIALWFICNGLLMLWRSRQPIRDEEVTRRRQEERQQLFRFAQGHISWRYWLGVIIQFLFGLFCLSLGVLAVLSFVGAQPPLASVLASFVLILLAWYSLSRAIRGARLLLRLKRLSSQELAARLSLGEATEGE